MDPPPSWYVDAADRDRETEGAMRAEQMVV